MAGLAEELGLAIAPRLRRAIVVSGGHATARTLEDRRGWLALWQELGNYGQNHGSRHDGSKDQFRRHKSPPYA